MGAVDFFSRLLFTSRYRTVTPPEKLPSYSSAAPSSSETSLTTRVASWETLGITMFSCHACRKSSLAITGRLNLGPDDDSDEVAIQVLRCSACSAAAIGLYEASRRGSGDSCHHAGWTATPAAVDEVDALIAACPSPGSHRCPCATHAALSGGAYERYLTGTRFHVER